MYNNGVKITNLYFNCTLNCRNKSTNYLTAIAFCCTLLILWLSVSTQTAAELPPTARNFAEISKIAQQEQKPIVIYISAEWCEFCDLLNEEVMEPLMLGGGFENGLLYTLKLDDTIRIKDFSEETVLPDAFAYKYGVDITPTIIFLNHLGKEIAPRMVGITNIEYYLYYLNLHAEIGIKNIHQLP